MGIRDLELKRLENYAKGLGLQVSYKRHKPGNPGAEWQTDGKLITLYTWPGQSKTKLILNFCHELSHHLHYIYSNKTHEPELIEALKAEKPTKEQRWLIYQDELNGINYREFVVKEVDIKISSDKIKEDIELDKFNYKHFYETGKFPTIKQQDEFLEGLE